MRVAGVKTIEQANEYLVNDYLVWWERELMVEPAHADDAHRPLDKSHNLAASLSHVETRQVRNDYTLRFEGELYQIERGAIVPRLRGANVRVEKRLDGAVTVRHGEKYLPVKLCVPARGEARGAVAAGQTGQPTSPAAARQRLGQELQSKESAKSMAGGAGSRPQTGSGGLNGRLAWDQEKVARRRKFARYRETLRTTGR